MILLTRLDHSSIVLNSDLIEYLESTPDTVISLSTGRKVTVRETPGEVTESTRLWRRSLLAGNILITGDAQITEFPRETRPSRG
jgi:flagellar protein FlbD